MQSSSYLALKIKCFLKMFIRTSHCDLWLISSNGKIFSFHLCLQQIKFWEGYVA